MSLTIQLRYDTHVISRFTSTYLNQLIGYCEGRDLCNIPPVDPFGWLVGNWEQGQNWRPNFVSTSVESPTNDDGQHLLAVTTQVDQALRNEQLRLYRSISQKLTADELSNAAIKLSGAQSLLIAYTELGFPRTLERDETMRSQLYGSERLVEVSQLQAAYRSALATLPTANVRPGIFDSLNSRSQSLRTALWKYLDQIDHKAYRESHRLLETTLNRQVVSYAMIHTAPLTATVTVVDPTFDTPTPVTPPPDIYADAR